MKPLITLSRLIIAAVMLASVSCRNERVITVRSLLKEMTSADALTRFPDPSYKLIQFSSYDRRSIHRDSAGWFANDDFTQFIREENNNGRREFVMFEAEGPGAIVRWWMTFGNLNAYNSYVRIYIDNQTVPVIEGNAPALVGGEVLVPSPLSASVSPLTEPQQRGYDLYMPLPFSKSCKVTLENDSVVITTSRRYPSIYYSISARIYEKGTRVASLHKETLKADTLAMTECAARLLQPKYNEIKGSAEKKESEILSPGASYSLRFREKGRAISRLILSIGADDATEALRHTIIKMTFDGKETVNVPAGYFFGTGYTINQSSTYFSHVDQSGMMTIERLMPFRDSCEVKIINDTGDSLMITTMVTTVPYKWDDRSMHFGASWHEYRGIETAGAVGPGATGRHFDITFADLKGKGVYAGDAVTVSNTADAWWGEGDEKIYVDGEIFPSSFGTGTEDYFGYAWCRPEPFSHPFFAQPTGSGNYHPGMSVNMRYRILDAIPFNESLKADIELWHWVKTTIDYSLISYYYLVP